VLLERRPPRGVWGGLWCPPELGEESATDWAARTLGAGIDLAAPLAAVRHGFSHFELEIEPLPARLVGTPTCLMEPGRWVWYNARSPAKLGLASVVSRLIGAVVNPGIADELKEAS
jgi:A/G-specific adenine glycosylase